MATQIPEMAEALAHRVAVLHRGSVIACDTNANLRTQTKCEGDLGEVLALMIHPETFERIDRYFERSSA